MKKGLLFLGALMLSLAVSAQSFKPLKVDMQMQRNPNPVAKLAPKNFGKLAPQPKRAEGTTSTRYCGLYDDNTLDEDGVGLPDWTGDNKVGIILTSEQLAKYAGFKIVGMRAGIMAEQDSCHLFLMQITSSGLQEYTGVDVEPTTNGWNEVTFAEDKQLTIPADGNINLVAGYSYTQTNDNTAASYPIGIAQEKGSTSYMLVYANIPASDGGQGLGWYYFNSYIPAIQLVVQGELPNKDIVLKTISVQPFVKTGAEAKAKLNVYNFGSSDVNYSLKVQIDGTDNSTYTSSAKLAANATEDIEVPFTMPADAATGSHTVKVSVSAIDGETPTVNTDNDELETSVKAYKASVARQRHLVEQFTSQYCTWCPLGYDVLNALYDSRDDVSWVSVHGNMGNGTDEYRTATCDSIFQLEGVESFPSATLDRSIISSLGEATGEGDALVHSLGYKSQYTSVAAQAFSAALDDVKENMPSFAPVDIKLAYDEATTKLTVTVSGTGAEGAADMLKNYGMNVVITEDGLVSKQLNQGKWVQDYAHNHVLRATLTPVTGGTINWDGDSYSNTYTYTIPSTYVAKNLRVVAFISQKTADFTNPDYEALDVNNCNEANVSDVVTGISGVEADEAEAKVVARYTVDGRQISAPVKGVNIVRLSNGKTKKVVVK